jgi:hypothetical protein
MKSKLIDDNLTALLYQEYSNKVHQRKLQQIKNRKNLTVSLSLDPQPKERKKPKGFLNIAKMNEVMRENKLLHEKLLVISERKASADCKMPSNSPRTLNHTIRKKMSDQIILENSSIIQRLLEKSSRLSIKQMKIDYEINQKYKENLSKHKVLDRIKKIVKKLHLPSLEPIKNLTCDSQELRVSAFSEIKEKSERKVDDN